MIEWIDPFQDVSEQFIDFINDIFNELDAVLDLDNHDVTKEFIEESIGYYKQGNYKEIRTIIVDQNLSVSHQIETEMNAYDVTAIYGVPIIDLPFGFPLILEVMLMRWW